MAGVYRFGRFELSASACELRRGSNLVKLEKLAMELLLFLVAQRHRLVSRDEIAEQLWGKDVYVDAENGLNTAIRKVRYALGDDPGKPKFIQTVPGRGYRFIAPVIEEAQPASATSQRVLVAVLPFVNLTGDTAQEYFCDGMTEETIANLGAVSPKELGVIARTSSMAYRTTKKPIKQIGKELGVNYVVESSVRREGSRIRVTAQLIRIKDQTHIWAQCYDRDSSSLLGIQTELGRAIAEQVNAKLPIGATRMRVQTGNPDAFDLYLRGRYHFADRTPLGITRAIEYYGQALQIDPDYSLAEAGLADAYATLPITSDCPTEECRVKGVPAAERAVAGNEYSAEARTALAACKFWLTWDWDGAIREANQAIELNPSYSLAHFYLAHAYSNLRRQDEAEQEMKKAKALDPLSIHLRAIHGQMLFQADRYDAAADEARSALALNPNSWLGNIILGKVQIEHGNFKEAIDSLQRAFQFSGGNTEPLGLKAFAFAKGGEREKARDIVRVMEEIAQSRYLPPYNLAMAYNGLGEHAKSLELLERAAKEKDVRMVFLALDPKWKVMNRDPRVRRLWPVAQQ
jgi:TolB-like protein/Flp pilus assembly protein TadD